MTTPTSIISAIQSWLTTNASSLKSASPLLVDFLGAKPTQYSIVPLPAKDITWGIDYQYSERMYYFAFQSMEHTESDPDRIAANAFYEALSDWFDTETRSGNLPTLPTGKNAVAIQANSLGFLYNEGQSGTGVYQIQCQLSYDQIDS